MQDLTFLQAQNLKTSLTYLNQIKAELAVPETQPVIILKKRVMPAAPPAALTDALGAVEGFLLAQAVTAIQDQIDALQLSFDNLQDT